MSGRISTPASRERRPTVAVLGAGIAGLTAAHELAERGFVVTVYESREDERNGLEGVSAGSHPPVKLGGLAASQYSTVGTNDGSHAELRPFPGRRGRPCTPTRAVAGEHGFRFFPAFYLHIWDLFQRIPVYRPERTADGTMNWMPTSRTVYDNVCRVVSKGVVAAGAPSLIFPSELPRSPAEFLGTLGQLEMVGFTPGDVATYASRLVRYMTTGSLRRAQELHNVSAYEFLVGHDRESGTNRFTYTPRCDAMLRQMPRILVALDSMWGDARTNMSTYLQLYLNMDRRDNKADGVLNGPTTEAWLDHWYRYLAALGVDFVRNEVSHLDAPPSDPTQHPHLRPRAQITFADGTRVTPDYTVVAVDAPGAEYITAPLRAAGAGGTIAGLDGFATSSPPTEGPLQPKASRPQERRDPYSMDETGRLPWDRFQTLCGIQYYFDTEFQLLRGHLLLTGTEWALSSINQSGFWERQPVLEPDGHISVLSVDIGDFNTPSSHLVDEFGRGKTARDCAADEIAAEVWRQIVCALTSYGGIDVEDTMPWPAWYALDRGLIMATGPGGSQGRVVRNETPYLVPIVGDWDNRPGGDPWNPHGTSWTRVPREDVWRDDLDKRGVWQAGHGGYQVHNNSVVFAGTWTKTFTRVTSMESACESARHAVNAVLDHYIWVESGGRDRRENEIPLRWKFPFGFLDQGMSTPVRMPTPAGDYCYVFDLENREPAEARPLRNQDSELCMQSQPHQMDLTPSPMSHLPGGSTMYTPTSDYNQQVLAYLQAWRQLLEQWTALTAGSSTPIAPLPTPFTAPMPAMGQFMAPMPPSGLMSPAPADYTQQLFSALQAWRQHLEQMTMVAPGVPHPPYEQTPNPYAGGASTDGQATSGHATDAGPPPDHSGGSGGNYTNTVGNTQDPSWPPQLINKPPPLQNESVGPVEIPAIDFDGRNRRRGSQTFGNTSTLGKLSGPRGGQPAQSPVASAFLRAISRVNTDAPPKVAAPSLFSKARVDSSRLRDVGQPPLP